MTRDGPLPPDPAGRPAAELDVRGQHDARRPRRADADDRARPARRRRRLPQPGAARQDHHDARRDLRRPGVPRHRRGLVRGRARRLRLRVPAAQGALRAPRGPPADRPRHVHAGAGDGRRRRTTRSAAPTTTRSRCAATSRSSSAAAASARRCGWSPSTPTAATCSATPSGRGICSAFCSGHCENVGRDPAEITKTSMMTHRDRRDRGRRAGEARRDARRRASPKQRIAGTTAGTPEQVLERAHAFRDVGIEGVTFSMPDVHDLEAVTLAGGDAGPACSFPAADQGSGRARNRLGPLGAELAARRPAQGQPLHVAVALEPRAQVEAAVAGLERRRRQLDVMRVARQQLAAVHDDPHGAALAAGAADQEVADLPGQARRVGVPARSAIGQEDGQAGRAGHRLAVAERQVVLAHRRAPDGVAHAHEAPRALAQVLALATLPAGGNAGDHGGFGVPNPRSTLTRYHS